MGKADPVTRPAALTEARSGATVFPLSPAVLAGIGAIQIAIVLAFISLYASLIPLTLFIVLCMAAPFKSGMRFFMPVITHGARGNNVVALTFDDGPSMETTPHLLALLKKYNVPATHFVIGAKAAANPGLIEDMLAQGHTLANHTMNHDVFIMLKSSKRLGQEIEQCQNVLADHGVRPLIFRPPVGIVNPRLWRQLLVRGMHCVIFSVRGGDMGNRRVTGIARRVLMKVKDGDIVILHDRALKTKEMVEPWLKEMEKVIIGIQAKGLRIVPLADLIGQPVMNTVQGGFVHGPVAGFYDGIAGLYDREQDSGLISVLRRAEHEAVIKRLPSFIGRQDRVLEIGSGTGLYTLELAHRAKEVVAVDVSGGMLNVLGRKAAQAHLENIKYVKGDIQEISIDGKFGCICAFSSFEYVPDLAGLVRRLAGHLEPGGVLYFTTAHRGFFRFWAQVGNAMRQGVWLHARNIPEIRKALLQARLTPVVIQPHGLNQGFINKVFLGGVLLEVMAKKT
ncbi:MAG: polysaccharide deacetylase family protein [Deltaproteobacteria bacterium]|nr:polysaccharide deacetylase family protein [Deltaproteobacteria bacterium]